MAKQYLDLAGLQEFLSKIKNYYATASYSDVSTKVGYAAEAGSAHSLLYTPLLSVSGDATSSSYTFDGVNDVSLQVTIPTADGSGTGTKGLMSATQAVKLESVEAGAQPNKIENIKIATGVKSSVDEDGNPIYDTDGTPKTEPDYKDATIVNKSISINLSNYATKDEITAVFRFKGVVDYVTLPQNAGSSVTALPTDGNIRGYVYHVIADGGEYVWDGSKWEALGPIISGFATDEALDVAITDLRNSLIDGDITVGVAALANTATTAVTAQEASKTTGALSIKKSNTETVSYNGSSNQSIDLSIYGLQSDVESKADKVVVDSSKTANTLAGLNTSGNLVESNIELSRFDTSNASISEGDNHFVTGSIVNSAIAEKLGDGVTTYEFESGTGGSFTVQAYKGGVKDGDVKSITTGSKIEAIKVNGGSTTNGVIGESLTINTSDNSVDIDMSKYSVGVVATDTVDSFTKDSEADTYDTKSSEPVSGKAVYNALVGTSYISSLTTDQINSLFVAGSSS